ncbi:MAG: flagellar hook-basal body complex protein [Pseudomonadota bacterium]
MTISSSLNAGVAGLSVNATRLATISDNIANAGTFGYKRSIAEFHSLVISNSRGSYSAGGVRVTTSRLIDQPGALVTTSNSTDLAVRGRGFLPVTTGSSVDVTTGEFPLFLTTTGSFRTDADGYLRTSTGVTLMGWPANADGSIPTFSRDTSAGLEPVQVNVNQFTSEPTTNISLGVNLPATETLPGSPGASRELSVEYFDNLGTSQSILTTFTPTVPAANPASNTWTLTMTDSAQGGTVIGEYTVVFDNSTVAGGTIASVSQAVGAPGGAYDPATGILTVNALRGPIDIDIGAVGTGTGLTQLSDDFAPTAIGNNGSPVGNLISVEVDENGFVSANFDIGITRVVYQIPLIDLPNPNGLEANDEQLYRPTAESGSFFLWDAADGPTGDIIGFALEESTTDVAGELTSLITTQRAYSSNAKVIQTVDEMLQETTNIKR